MTTNAKRQSITDWAHTEQIQMLASMVGGEWIHDRWMFSALPGQDEVTMRFSLWKFDPFRYASDAELLLSRFLTFNKVIEYRQTFVGGFWVSTLYGPAGKLEAASNDRNAADVEVLLQVRGNGWAYRAK